MPEETVAFQAKDPLRAEVWSLYRLTHGLLTSLLHARPQV